MRNRAIFLAILLPQLLACTSTQEIVVDDRKANSRKYDRDLEDCSRLVGQIDAEGKVLKGLGSGVVIGGVSGAMNDEALRGVVTGGMLGGVKGLDEAMAIALGLASGPSVAYRYMKQNLIRAETAGLQQCIEFEAYNSARCVRTEDVKEAAAAFREKRAPKFTGR
ncbi:MAG: hypothetical protein P8J18_01355 [Halieaceae bacterium]|nr:hypothetical protein [Halieaceae bacterium]